MRSLGLAIGVAAIVIVFLLHLLGGNRAAIAQAHAASQRIASERDSLVAVVQEREELIASLGLERDTLESLAQWWRDSVDLLERDRAAAQLTIRENHSLTVLQAELRASFPELGDSAWRMLTIRTDPRDTLGIEYVAVPAWFAETFVIDHQNAASWRAQKDQLLVVDSLRLAVAALQDSIARLQSANTAAYRSGYDAAYVGYQDLSTRYVAELRKPRIRFGSAVQFLAAAGIGVVLGRAIPR
ncbi:MAG: hypothetical protein HY700_06435 [Gemmatimonadetes bacterium]|nr:hypothetical protein [Gemmatimonadota bacterium]